MNRWTYYKKQAEEKRIEEENYRELLKKCKFFIVHVRLLQILGWVDKEVNRLREDKIKILKKYFKVKRLQRHLRRFAKKKGRS